jgi:uncharacterized membrane protein
MGRAHSQGVESTAAVFHHPIHPMLIAFPVATLMAAPAADLAAQAGGDPFWRRAGRWLLMGGLLSGAAASAVGLVDYLAIGEVRRAPGAQAHAVGNAAAMGLVLMNLLRRPRDDSEGPDGTAMGLSLATVALLGATAWLGGELSYRHRVGVIASDSPTAAETLGQLLRRLA